MSEIKPLIEVDHLSFGYGPELVLDEVHFSIQPGDFVALVGPNGSGKTTLLKILLGLLKPDTGTIKIDGKPVVSGQQLAVGYVPQKVTQLENRFPITVSEMVELGLVTSRNLLRPLTSLEREKILTILKTVGLEKMMNRQLSDLSGGQQQRAFIAKALISEPKILILDEPTVGIDLKSQDDFYTLLADLNKNQHRTIIIVTHDIDVVLKEVRTVLCLNKSIVYHGDTHNFAHDQNLQQLYGSHHKLVVHDHAVS